MQYGEPPGNILSSLLFILYSHDIRRYLSKSFLNIYADYTVVSLSGTNSEQTVDLVNSERNSLKIWLQNNKLKLNT